MTNRIGRSNEPCRWMMRLRAAVIVTPLALAGIFSPAVHAPASARTHHHASPLSSRSLSDRLVGTWKSTDSNGPTGEDTNKVIISHAGAGRLKFMTSSLEGSGGPLFYHVVSARKLQGSDKQDIIYIVSLTRTRMVWRERSGENQYHRIRRWHRVGIAVRRLV